MSEQEANSSSSFEQRPGRFRTTAWKEILDLSETIMKQFPHIETMSEKGNEQRKVFWEEEKTGRTIDLIAQDLDSIAGPSVGYRMIVHPLAEGPREIYHFKDNLRKVNEIDADGSDFQQEDKDATERTVLGYLMSSGVKTEKMVREEALVDLLFANLAWKFYS